LAAAFRKPKPAAAAQEGLVIVEAKKRWDAEQKNRRAGAR
jgi:hypothetical protein